MVDATVAQSYEPAVNRYSMQTRAETVVYTPVSGLFRRRTIDFTRDGSPYHTADDSDLASRLGIRDPCQQRKEALHKRQPQLHSLHGRRGLQTFRALSHSPPPSRAGRLRRAQTLESPDLKPFYKDIAWHGDAIPPRWRPNSLHAALGAPTPPESPQFSDASSSVPPNIPLAAGA